MELIKVKFNTFLRLIYINHGVKPFESGLNPIVSQVKLGRTRAIDACVYAGVLTKTRISANKNRYQLLSTDFEYSASVCAEAYLYVSEVERCLYQSRKK